MMFSLGGYQAMGGVYGLVLAPSPRGFVLGPCRLIGIMLRQAGMGSALRRYHLVEEIQCRRCSCRQERVGHRVVDTGASHVHPRCGSIGGGHRLTSVAHTGFIAHPHLVTTGPTPAEASQQGLALAGPPAGPPGKATGLIRQARLVGETLLPTPIRGIGLLRHGLPVLHRALHAASLPGTLRGRKRAAPVDQRSGIGRLLAYRAQRRRGRFAPPHLSSLHAHQLAPWQENTIIPPAPHDLVAPTPWSTSRKDELQGMLKLSIGVFDAGPIVYAYQSRRQRLAVGAPRHLALPSGIPPQTADGPCRLAQQPPQAPEETVIILARVLDAFRIGNAVAHDGGKVQESIPIRVLPGQATGFIGHHEAAPPQRDRGDKFLQAWALAILARWPKVCITDVDPGGRPAEVNGALDQGILMPLAFELVGDLGGRRWAHRDIGMPVAVACRHLLLQSGRPAIPPGGAVSSSDAPAPEAWSTASPRGAAGPSTALPGARGEGPPPRGQQEVELWVEGCHGSRESQHRPPVGGEHPTRRPR